MPSLQHGCQWATAPSTPHHPSSKQIPLLHIKQQCSDITLENLPGQQTLHGLTKATYSTVCGGFAKQSWLHQFIMSKIVFSHSHSKIYKQAVHVQMFTAKCCSMRQAKRDLKSMMGLTNAPVCVLSSLWQATSKLDRVNMLCQCNLNNHITYYHKKSCVLTEARALHSNMSFITATIS